MKRHNFGGLRATHGVSVSHRSHGSTGNARIPARSSRARRWPGHMGAERVTTQNLKVRRHRRRARPDHGQGRGAGRRGRLGADPRRGEAAAARGRAVPGRVSRAAAAVRSEPARRPKRRCQRRRRERGIGDHEVRRHHARQQGGRRDRARRRGLRRCRCAADILARVVNWQLAKRRAGTHKAKGVSEVSGHDQEAVPPEGHRPGPPGQPCARSSSAAAASSSARWCATTPRPAEEGPQAGAQDGAVGQAGRGQAGRARRASSSTDAQDQGAGRQAVGARLANRR